MKDRLINELMREGIHNEHVLAALAKVPREKFVLEEFSDYAYENQALPLTSGQTISQPYVVAKMTEFLLSIGEMHSVLEIGTGSGYQAAVLAELFDQVYTVERVQELAESAEQRFKELNYKNIHVRYDDGFYGWPEHSPYDAIIGTAAAAEIPDKLLEQLSSTHGRLILPIGGSQFLTQQLVFVIKKDQHYEKIIGDSVMFVPMKHGLTPAKGDIK